MTLLLVYQPNVTSTSMMTPANMHSSYVAASNVRPKPRREFQDIISRIASPETGGYLLTSASDSVNTLLGGYSNPSSEHLGGADVQSSKTKVLSNIVSVSDSVKIKRKRTVQESGVPVLVKTREPHLVAAPDTIVEYDRVQIPRVTVSEGSR